MDWNLKKWDNVCLTHSKERVTSPKHICAGGCIVHWQDVHVSLTLMWTFHFSAQCTVNYTVKYIHYLTLYWTRLIEEGVIRLSLRLQLIKPSEINIYNLPNSITVLLFIQNISRTLKSQNVLNWVPVTNCKVDNNTIIFGANFNSNGKFENKWNLYLLTIFTIP